MMRSPAMSQAATTSDPGLRLDVDGRNIAPLSVADSVYRFEIGPGAAVVRLMSRTVVPAQDGGADSRRLGVAVTRLVLRGGVIELSLPFDDPSLTEGFYPAEAGHRWTDGAAVVPAAWLHGLRDGFTLEVRLSLGGLRYLTGG